MNEAITAKIVAFVGPRGGTGTTTVATNVAVAIASYSQARTALVDLNVGRTITAHLLDIGDDQGATVIDLMPALAEGSGAAVADSVVAQAQVTHSSGVRVLIASRGVAPVRLAPDAVRTLLRALARTNDVLIIDVPSIFDDATFAALDAADRVFVVATPDVPTIKLASSLLRRVRETKTPSAAELVLDQADRAGDLTLSQIESFVGTRAWSLLPSATDEASRLYDRRAMPVLDRGGRLGRALYLTALKLHPMKGAAVPA